MVQMKALVGHRHRVSQPHATLITLYLAQEERLGHSITATMVTPFVPSLEISASFPKRWDANQNPFCRMGCGGAQVSQGLHEAPLRAHPTRTATQSEMSFNICRDETAFPSIMKQTLFVGRYVVFALTREGVYMFVWLGLKVRKTTDGSVTSVNVTKAF